MPSVMTTLEVAVLMRLSEATVQRHIRAGVLPAISVGRTWRLRTVDVYSRWEGETMPADTSFDTLPEFLTAQEAAAVLRVSEDVIRRALTDESLPGVRIGSGRGQWRIRTADITAMFDQAAARAAQQQSAAIQDDEQEPEA